MSQRHEDYGRYALNPDDRDRKTIRTRGSSIRVEDSTARQQPARPVTPRKTNERVKGFDPQPPGVMNRGDRSGTAWSRRLKALKARKKDPETGLFVVADLDDFAREDWDIHMQDPENQMAYDEAIEFLVEAVESEDIDEDLAMIMAEELDQHYDMLNQPNVI